MTDDPRVLTLWVNYDSPSDYPRKLVVRRQHATKRAVENDPEAQRAFWERRKAYFKISILEERTPPRSNQLVDFI